jgi:hypothetical protein
MHHKKELEELDCQEHEEEDRAKHEETKALQKQLNKRNLLGGGVIG